jgi:heme/copper-type cytochrome/quinol oxidase subunit 2
VAAETLLVSMKSPPLILSLILADVTCRIVPLGILVIVLVVLFEVYKSDFERWAKPLTDWLRKREAWSWVIPVSILFILSFPPLFGHEIVQLIVGVSGSILIAGHSEATY